MRRPTRLSSSRDSFELFGITDCADCAVMSLRRFGRLAASGTLHGGHRDVGQRLLPELRPAAIRTMRAEDFRLGAFNLKRGPFEQGLLADGVVAKSQLLRLDAGQ